ncbi:XRE family transcriptional regulator [Dyella choica]|uniref:ImmA/IrrE family metallo-endopeptidase n=1 Tax=Dyella choica TaxID=1927959 RepID=A0A432M9R4_9GAMM|nr:XRE family transcriptional regulator [Dyella choica]RUL78954.1 ImmA/IrrE family metallo-endopeptidase [Dyella choica]
MNLRLIGKRLAQARNLLELAVEKVEADTGIRRARLASIESGTEAPSGDELLIMASYYARDVRDFIDPSRPEPFKETSILYRKHGPAFTAEDRRSVQEFLFLCEIEADLASQLNVERVSFEFKPSNGDLHKTHGVDAAAALRRTLGYTARQIRLDIYADFRLIGLHVFRRRLRNKDLSGLYIEHPVAGHCILVNYDEDIYRQRFSVSHEAAHAIFDSNDTASISYERSSSKYNKMDLKEIRANRFASHYLMPPTLLPRVPSWSKELALHWAQTLKVSTEALSYALREADLVDDAAARMIRSVRVPMIDKVDPEAPSNLSPSQLARRKELMEMGLSDYYVGLCFEAHHRGLISAGRLGEAFLSDYRGLREISVLYGRSIVNEL